MLKPRLKELKYKAEGVDGDAKNIFVFTSKTEFEIDEKSGYATEKINSSDDEHVSHRDGNDNCLGNLVSDRPKGHPSEAPSHLQ